MPFKWFGIRVITLYKISYTLPEFWKLAKRTPLRALLENMPNQISIWFSQLADIGVNGYQISLIHILEFPTFSHNERMFVRITG